MLSMPTNTTEPVSFELFAEIWQSSESLEQVAERVGRKKSTCEQTAVQMRKAGVALKSMRKNPLRSEQLTEELVAKINAKIKTAG